MRPRIEDIKLGKELKRWYWLKQELIDHCKFIQVSYKGSKFEILDRLAQLLDAEIVHPQILSVKPKPASKFNWAKSELSLSTIITDNYTNGFHTRKFFKEQCGDKFRFSIPFMQFMKNNCGKTLHDAVDEWHRLQALHQDGNFKTTIPAGNQYNQYLRDFFSDNPDLSLTQARHFWKLKRSLPYEKHIYEKSDLNLK